MSSQLPRRQFLARAGTLAGAGFALSMPAPAWAWRKRRGPKVPRDPFTLGVASGDPTPSGFVLWTRLAPNPLNGGGMPKRVYPVRWEVATDPNMRKVVCRGTTIAHPYLGHSVHVNVRGLKSDRWYWYRFTVGGERSRIGRTRTMPRRNAKPKEMRFAFASCQDYQNGFYSAYYNMAKEDLDFVVHLGDYIYEYGPAGAAAPREHIGDEIESLTDYRNRYAQYKLDPSLQDVHANFPFIVTWDDHELDNNYAGDIPEDDQTAAAFNARKVAAYQVYYENMPLGLRSLPRDDRLRLYRRVRFGDLAQFYVLDTRQFRTDQPCGDGIQLNCADALDPSQTLTGERQEKWLFRGLKKSDACWNVLAQQVMMMQANFAAFIPPEVPAGSTLFNVDAWDGYAAQRQRILEFLDDEKISNPVILTGDIHSSWAADLKLEFDNPTSKTVASEYVGTSISSDFPIEFNLPILLSLPANPHIKYFDGTQRGYVRCTVDRELWQADFRHVTSILDPKASVATVKTFVTEAGKPGVVEA